MLNEVYVVIHSEYEGPWKVVGAFEYETDAKKMVNYFVSVEKIPPEKFSIQKIIITRYCMD